MAKKRRYSGPKQRKEPEVATKQELARGANAATRKAAKGTILGMFGHRAKGAPPRPRSG